MIPKSKTYHENTDESLLLNQVYMSARLPHFSQFGPENVASCFTIPEKQWETNHWL